MNIFLNDYNDLCHEEVYKKLALVNQKGNAGYGNDEYCERAKQLIKKDLKNDNVHIEFVSGGTVANIIAISANLLPYESVIAAASGHITGHEAGSIEATGHKIEIINTEDGKLNDILLEKKIDELTEEYHTVPKIVYISQTTELGSVYSYAEIEDIYNVCLERGLYLYIDGARMAHGLAASDIEIEDLCNICDIFTLGGTKNGAIYGEVLVIVEPELKQNIRNFMKQRGAVMAKSFAIGAQFEALFENGLYYKLADKAYDMSVKLVRELKNIGVKFFKAPESNQVFIIYPLEKIKQLEIENRFEVMPYLENEKIIRFVTNYRTTEDEINGLIKCIKELK
ncbi:threonine aldolase family protein [Peptoniphilus mikwangii]|uniref:threonine aldolase family protein n=1 Tax=Peptoniphilus mikwangii TaxID=1354300 RepID=UPI0003F90564|nr:aminotransferase class V-fold PLP-dependent enzyme [Peptoniphilus mikwangii]